MKENKYYRVFNNEDLVDHDAIAAVIRREDDRILMLHHKKYDFWTIPIGKVKADQTIHEALVEEIREECNIIIDGFKEVTSFKEHYERTDYYIAVTSHIFEVTRFTGVGINAEPEKHFELRWLSESEIENMNISDPTRVYLKNKIRKEESKRWKT